MEQAITDGVDAILTAPADSKAIVPAIEKANKAGILVATPNTKAYGGNVLTWSGVDNYQVGYEPGIALCESIKGKGNVLLIEAPRKANALRTPSAPEPRSGCRCAR